jgi:hypothetical protein
MRIHLPLKLFLFCAFIAAIGLYPSHPFTQLDPPDKLVVFDQNQGNHVLIADQPTIEVMACGLEIGATYSISISAYQRGASWELKALGKSVSKAEAGQKILLTAQKTCESVLLYPNGVYTKDERLLLAYQKKWSTNGPNLSISLNPPAITTDTNPTAEELIRDVLIGGDCFEIVEGSINFSGTNAQRGIFSNGISSIGIQEGVILSTGAIENATGPNESPSSATIFDFNTADPQDPDLAGIASDSLYDIAILEFDFIPTVDVIQFNYVFASEEYCFYVDSEFNDVFGFFLTPLSGGITENLAQLPGGAGEVSINNVNHITNSTFYVPNIPEATGEVFPGDTSTACVGHPLSGATDPAVLDCQFDGFTVVLTATAEVVPCEPYHIKLAIADVGDADLDAAVFLQANSFNAGVTAGVEAVGSDSVSNVVYESCGDGFFKFFRAVDPDTSILEVNYTISGTAENGVDYGPIPASVIIPAGEECVFVPLNVVDDGIAEGPETIRIELEIPCDCDDPVIEMIINDPLEIEPNLSTVDVLCFGADDGSALVNPTGGSEPYEVKWNDVPGINSIGNLSPGDYTVMVTDANGCSVMEDFTINEPDPLDAMETIDIVPCVGDSTGKITLTVAGGTPPYVIAWDNGAVGPMIEDLAPGTYGYSIFDNNQCELSGEIELAGNPLPEVMITTTNSCFAGATGTAEAMVDSGTPPYTYAWSVSPDDAPVITGIPAGTGYSLTVTDQNGCSSIVEFDVEEDAQLSCTAFVVSEITTYDGSDGEISVTPPVGSTAPYTYAWDTPGADNTQTVSGLPAGTYSVTVTDVDGCQSTCSVTLQNPSKIGDFVWEDANENGQQDAGEPGLADIPVFLSGTDADGNPVNLSTTTDTDGRYLFDGLSAGTYTLTFTGLPLDWIFTQQDVGSDESDSDVDADGMTAPIALDFDTCLETIDAGAYNQCDNIEDPGEIAGDEFLCGPGNDPALIIEVSPATGGSGAIEYVWMMSEQGGPFGNGTYSAIPDSNTPTYDPGPIAVTTFLRSLRTA